MSETVIQARKISKQYRLGMRFGPGEGTLRETLTRAVRSSLSFLQRPAEPVPVHRTGASGKNGYIWALKDVAFDVDEGEVVGIIGRNGAGKSTLLKILSRVTEPTEGEATIYGRVGSLLEVGTGFHPELTGRENIFLNGAILGMRRTEILRKFDEIVAFAELERFIETPVKYYSSGMYMRLAFAVAAHLDPEILIVDEVLAVGDAAFKKKCLGKMGDVARSGRAVLFVSHNAHAIRSLCSRAILLKDGQVHADGKPLEVLAQYERENQGVRIMSETVRDSGLRRGSGEVRFTSIKVLDSNGKTRHEFEPGETICFSVAYECRSEVPELSVLVALKCEQGEQNVTTVRHVLSPRPLPAGYKGVATIELPEAPLRPGCFPLYFWLGRLIIAPYDVVDEMIEPLVIYSTRDSDKLGYDPANADSYVSLKSTLTENGPAPSA